MSLILKYKIDCDHEHITTIPRHGRVLKVANDVKDNQIFVWVEHGCKSDFGEMPLDIMCVATGFPFPGGGKYIDTVVHPSGLIWHFYLNRRP